MKPRRGSEAQAADLPEPAAVEAFLRANPCYLASHPALYRVLEPPKRVHGETLSDHMAAMLEAERARGAEMKRRAEAMVEVARANATSQDKAQRAVLAVMMATSPAEAMDVIQQDWPSVLGVDVVTVCAEGRAVPGARPLPRGFVARLVPERAGAVLRPAAFETEALYGEASALVASDSLARMKLPRGGEALLACGTRDPGAFEPGQGTDLITFLAEAAAIALTRGT